MGAQAAAVGAAVGMRTQTIEGWTRHKTPPKFSATCLNNLFIMVLCASWFAWLLDELHAKAIQSTVLETREREPPVPLQVCAHGCSLNWRHARLSITLRVSRRSTKVWHRPVSSLEAPSMAGFQRVTSICIQGDRSVAWFDRLLHLEKFFTVSE